ncbi:WS/DGAT domain-containing protein [Lolliginicoccus suaedae]|uniref:WS/DGAT domain-containing protein n=1 Tax=Lolliginicoccus suaedae TaxID=2605429 RepID=UPI001659C354|nr:WS/DGAT domain-containing protein [Lolliginicoccus suaedae]
MERIDGIGALFYYLFGEPFRRAVVAAYAFDSRAATYAPATLDELGDYVMNRIGDEPLMHQRLAPTPLKLDNPAWVADGTKPGRRRITSRTVRGTGTWADMIATLEAIAAEPDAGEVPLEVILIEGVEAAPELPPGATVIVLRTDHAAMDGTARAAIERKLFSPQPQDWRQQAPIAPYQARRSVLPQGILLTALVGLVPRLRTTVQLFRQANRIVDPLLDGEGPPPPTDPGESAEPEPLPVRSSIDTDPDESSRVHEFLTVPLDSIAAARKTVPGATVNDVVVAAVTLAVRAYLAETDELPDEPLQCFIPIAVPSAAGRTAGNNITRGTIPLWTTAGDPTECLRLTHRTTTTVKNSAATGRQFLHEQAALTLLAPLAARLHRKDTEERRSANVAITNTFRGKQPLYLGDAPAVRTQIVSLLNKGAPLTHQVTNLNDELMVSISGGASALRDPQRYRQHIEAAFLELAQGRDAALADDAGAPSSG